MIDILLRFPSIKWQVGFGEKKGFDFHLMNSVNKQRTNRPETTGVF